MKKAVLGLALMSISLFSSPHAAVANDTVYFGVIPLESQRAMKTKFTPLAEYLSKEIGKPVEVVVGKDYQST